jgi:hypothetical protein
MRIRAAREDEFPVLQEIERAAGQSFADIGMAQIAQDEPHYRLSPQASGQASCGRRLMKPASLLPT